MSVKISESSTVLILQGSCPGLPTEPYYVQLFMDTFAEALEAVPRSISKEPCKLFADEIKLSAVYSKRLQIILDLESKWALENGMKWNTKKSVRYMDKRHTLA